MAAIGVSVTSFVRSLIQIQASILDFTRGMTFQFPSEFFGASGAYVR